MTEDNPFPKGIFFDAPHENAPDFIRGCISIKGDEAIDWIRSNLNEQGYVKLDMKLSKGGKMYLAKNDFQPKPQANPVQGGVDSDGPPPPQPIGDGIPF
jgi:hypothetical protein